MTDIPKGYIKKKSVTIPFGYKLSSIQGYLAPIPSQLEELNKTLHKIYNKEASLREGALLLSEKTDRKISHVSLKTYLDKDLWLIFPEEYVTVPTLFATTTLSAPEVRYTCIVPFESCNAQDVLKIESSS